MNKFKHWKIVILLIGVIIFLVLLTVFIYPKFKLKNFQEIIEISYNDLYEDNYNDVCFGNIFSCHEVAVKKDGNVDTKKLGEYKVTYTFSYQNNVIVKEQIVKVMDKKAPTLEVNGENLKYCPNGSIPVNFEIKAIDDIDGDLSDKVLVKAEDSKLVFSVADGAGNEVKVFKDARKIDEEAPKINLIGDNLVYLQLNQKYEENGVKAVDNCDGDISEKVIREGEVDSSKEGKYVITYKVSDSSGLSSSTNRTVYVYQAKNYAEKGTKNVYLTFDDGPSAYTGQLLDVLKKYNVKATFFLTSQNTSKGYDDMIKREYDEGHTVAIHSYTHSYSYIYASVDNYFEDLTNMQNKIYNLTGYKTMIVRFPGGSSNTISKNYDNGSHIMSNLAKMLGAKGYRYFDWNVLSGDAGETTDTKQIVKNVTSNLKSGTSVVLQHDTKNFSVNAVEDIIKYGIENGYNFLPLTMDSPSVEHSINN